MGLEDPAQLLWTYWSSRARAAVRLAVSPLQSSPAPASTTHHLLLLAHSLRFALGRHGIYPPPTISGNPPLLRAPIAHRVVASSRRGSATAPLSVSVHLLCRLPAYHINQCDHPAHSHDGPRQPAAAGARRRPALLPPRAMRAAELHLHVQLRRLAHRHRQPARVQPALQPHRRPLPLRHHLLPPPHRPLLRRPPRR